jgi:transcriptional regulator with XRE-family HTH domain
MSDSATVDEAHPRTKPAKTRRPATDYEKRTAEKVALGQRLQIAREQAGYGNQLEAAKELGYTAAVHLSQMETGSRPVPLAKLVEMARLYGTTTDFLLGLTPEVDRDPAVAMQAQLTAQVSGNLRRLIEQMSTMSVGLARTILPDVTQGQRLATLILEINRAMSTVATMDGKRWESIRGGNSLAARINAAADAATQYLGQVNRARRLATFHGQADITGRRMQYEMLPLPGQESN